MSEVPTAGLLPSSASPLSQHDEAVFLLHTAAEIEHALLAQYLYAAFSLGERAYRPELTADQRTNVFDQWQPWLLQIAKEEMGHLVTLQNILRLIGGPLNFEREDFPFRTDFYPFPFCLEPVTKDSLAKYVATEKPASPDAVKYPLVSEILVRAVHANNSLPINRVGALYDRLSTLIQSLPLEHFHPETLRRFQTEAAEWGQIEDPNDPRAIIVWSFGGSKRAARDKAVRSLQLIGEQGEGPRGATVEDSHFHLFYDLYTSFPETNPRFGVVDWLPSLEVPTHPSTSPDAFSDTAREDNRITHPLSVAWAQLFNSRYRILLIDLVHALATDRVADPEGRTKLIEWALSEMFALSPVSRVTSRLPRQLPNVFFGGRAASAGTPFELPYTLTLPDLDPDRWRVQLDLLQESSMLISAIRSLSGNPPDAAAVLDDLAIHDRDREKYIRLRIRNRSYRPRLYFAGKFTTNVNTVNNNDFQTAIDVTHTKVDLQGMSEDQFREWMKQGIDLGEGRRAIRSGWNYFGDNGCQFVDAKIVGASGDPASHAGDPAIGASVRLDGVMVDVDPANVFDTQIFSDRIEITGPAGVAISARPTVLHSRWLSFGRNLNLGGSRSAGTIFQAGLAWNDGLSIRGDSSAIVQELREAAEQSHGLILTFSTFAVAAALNTAQLEAEYQAGREPANPATGEMVGFISPWNDGDLSSLPAGRRLQPVLGGESDIAVGPATAIHDADSRLLVLNLLQSIPETDGSLEKHDFGPLEVSTETDSGRTILGELAFERYNRAAYVQAGGQAELPLDETQTQAVEVGTLVITQKSTGRELLREQVWCAETDQRGMYLQEGETRSLSVSVFERGHAPATPVRVFCSELIAEGASYRQVSEAERLLNLPGEFTVGASGVGEVKVEAVRAGARFIGFTLNGQLTEPMNPLTGSYAAIRVLPKDNFSGTTNEEVTFAKVYAEVLQYYHLTYPAMSKVFPLNDEAAVAQQAPAILAAINEEAFASYRYMPRTRELSDGKRDLLARWAQGAAAPPPVHTPEENLLLLVQFLQASPHNAAQRHTDVELESGQTLADLFDDPAALLAYLASGNVINDEIESGNRLVVAGHPEQSAFVRIIGRVGHPMRSRFTLVVPGTGKTGVQIVEDWVRSLP